MDSSSRPDIAYIKIADFDENTSQELDDNLKRLGQDHFQGLVLDLRNNPGGILNEAVDVAGAFLRRGATVVSARGREYPAADITPCATERAAANIRLWCWSINTARRRRKSYPGALQDHDRAWILGETTFGKGWCNRCFRFPMARGWR